MAQRYRGRQAVYLVTVPADWKPSSPWSVPPSFENGEVYAKNLPMYQAQGFARTFNKRQIEDRMPGRKWAVVSKHLQARRHGLHPLAVAETGGVA